MLQTIRTYIEKHKLLQPTDTIIVGFSGGCDSVALLHILTRLNYTCIAAHCNFHLRGAESDRDEAFARQTAETLHIPFVKKDFDTADYAAIHQVSIEMAARELRYQWFEELRNTWHAQAIAIAHHQDDSIETMLLNLIRGTGIRGLCGIRPKNNYIVRPLLSISRAQILEWLTQQGLTYQTDSSNLSDIYTRNFIRLRLLPMMEEINPSVREALHRTSEHLSDAEAIYLSYVNEARKELIDKEQRISISKLLQSPAPKSILYELIEPFGFTRSVAEDIYNALDAEPGKIFFAPKSNMQLTKDRQYLLITAKQKKNETLYTISSEGKISDPINLQTITKIISHPFVPEKNPKIATFDFDKLTSPLTLRTWHDGDWFVPFGMNGRKKLSDYFSDHHYSLPQKATTWLLCSGDDIIWIIGERIDNRFRTDDFTKKVLIASIF